MNVKDQLKALMLFIHVMTPKVRKRFISSFDEGMRCHYCRCKLIYTDKNSPQSPTYDHKTPKSKGGSDADENLVISCVKCNQAKGNMDYEAFISINKPVEYRNKLMQKIHEQHVQITKLEQDLESASLEKSKTMSWGTRRIQELSHQLKQYEDNKDTKPQSGKLAEENKKLKSLLEREVQERNACRVCNPKHDDRIFLNQYGGIVHR